MAEQRKRGRHAHIDHRYRRHGVTYRPNRAKPSAEPANRAGQRNIETAQRVRSEFNASSRRRHGHAALNQGERARQSGGEEIRDQAEGPAAVAAVPTRNPQSRWRYALVTAMAGKAATASRV